MRTASASVWALPCCLLLACSARGCSEQSSAARVAPVEQGARTKSPAVLAATTDDDDSPELRARLQAALQARGAGYQPRTRHEHPDGTPRYTNRLILESSPYLLQHAHNPVNWFAGATKPSRERRP